MAAKEGVPIASKEPSGSTLAPSDPVPEVAEEIPGSLDDLIADQLEPGEYEHEAQTLARVGVSGKSSSGEDDEPDIPEEAEKVPPPPAPHKSKKKFVVITDDEGAEDPADEEHLGKDPGDG